MTSFRLLFQPESAEQLNHLQRTSNLSTPLKAVNKCLAHLQTNPRHPSLNTHNYDEFSGPKGEVVFEAYAQNRTPGAYRIFWFYGPERN